MILSQHLQLPHRDCSLCARHYTTELIWSILLVSYRVNEVETSTDDTAEAQRGEVICLRAHSSQEADPGFMPGRLDSRTWALSHPLYRFLTTWLAETQTVDPTGAGCAWTPGSTHTFAPQNSLGCACQHMTHVK